MVNINWLNMNTIRLENVLPEVFASGGAAYTPGEVWERDVTFERPGHYLVVAASGTGKSSLCSYLYGNRSDYRGHIYFDGRDVRTFTLDDWCRLRRDTLALLPQEMRVFGELSAYDNVDIKNRLTGHFTRARILEMFELLGIADKADTPAARLSIGQQQRVAVIRTLCQPFSFLLLDEPVSHLDALNNDTVAGLVLAEAAAQDAAIIATSVGNHLNINYNTRLAL